MVPDWPSRLHGLRTWYSVLVRGSRGSQKRLPVAVEELSGDPDYFIGYWPDDYATTFHVLRLLHGNCSREGHRPGPFCSEAARTLGNERPGTIPG